VHTTVELLCDNIYRVIYLCLFVRVYVLSPARVAIDSRSLSVFLALWRRGARHVTLFYFSIRCLGTCSAASIVKPP
jgi:hypothetical protein